LSSRGPEEEGNQSEPEQSGLDSIKSWNSSTKRGARSDETGRGRADLVAAFLLSPLTPTLEDLQNAKWFENEI